MISTHPYLNAAWERLDPWMCYRFRAAPTSCLTIASIITLVCFTSKHLTYHVDSLTAPTNVALCLEDEPDMALIALYRGSGLQKSAFRKENNITTTWYAEKFMHLIHTWMPNCVGNNDVCRNECLRRYFPCWKYICTFYQRSSGSSLVFSFVSVCTPCQCYADYSIFPCSPFHECCIFWAHRRSFYCLLLFLWLHFIVLNSVLRSSWL